MGCCNHRRSAMRMAAAGGPAQAPARNRTATVARPAAGRSASTGVRVRYLGTRAARVRDATGRVYLAAAVPSELLVDARFLAGLLRTRQFAQV